MKFFKNTSWLLAERVFRMVIGLFVGIWVARYLGPKSFGVYSYAQIYVGFFFVIATLGINGITIRELVKDETKRDVLLVSVFLLKLVGALLVFMLKFGCALSSDFFCLISSFFLKTFHRSNSV